MKLAIHNSLRQADCAHTNLGITQAFGSFMNHCCRSNTIPAITFDLCNRRTTSPRSNSSATWAFATRLAWLMKHKLIEVNRVNSTGAWRSTTLTSAASDLATTFFVRFLRHLRLPYLSPASDYGRRPLLRNPLFYRSSGERYVTCDQGLRNCILHVDTETRHTRRKTGTQSHRSKGTNRSHDSGTAS
jgi:hypothetical protein